MVVTNIDNNSGMLWKRNFPFELKSKNLIFEIKYTFLSLCYQMCIVSLSHVAFRKKILIVINTNNY